jgi:ribosomal protein S18 acetylase RimI-like enzyme
VVELHVAPERRGQGLGARLLAHAEMLARARGVPRLVLSTLIDNPARRLYTRSGYRVVAERTAAGYAAFTGSPGRVLMEKILGPVERPRGA